MTTTSDPRISQSGEWFYVTTQLPGAHADVSDGGDLGSGRMETTTRFRSEEAAIYYLRSEDFRKRLAREEAMNLAQHNANAELVAELHSIPRWIRALFSKSEHPEEYPNG